MMKALEIRHNYMEALGDTIMEKNESVYVSLIQELRDKLGGVINYMVVSKDWWDDNWSQVWLGHVFKPVQIPEHTPNGIKVATFHDTFDVYVSDYYDEDRDWVLISCPEGVGLMTIEGFR